MSSMTAIGRAVVLAATLNATATGGPDGPRIVVQSKPDFALWDADRKIDPGVVGLVYRVEQAERFNLLLNAPGRGVRGWSRSSEVISLGLAEDYFSRAMVVRPRDPFPRLMRAVVRAEKGDADGAMADLDEALRDDPSCVPALVRRASMLRARDQPDRALADLDRAIAGAGRQPSPYVARAALRFAGKDLAGAWADLDRAAGLGSNDPDVPILRGRILLERKDTRRAHEAFVTALKADASRHDGYLGLASAYLMRGQPKNAQAVLDDAVRGDPDNPEAYGNRATFYLARGRFEQALYNLDEVIRLAPGSARAYHERAWLLATCRVETLRDPARAVESATRACELTGWKDPRYLSTLAAACSEGGDFAGAVHNQERALALLGEGSAEHAEYRRLLDRYRMRRPHHALGLLDEIIIRSLPAAQAGG